MSALPYSLSADIIANGVGMSEADAVEVVPLACSTRASVTVTIVCLARSLSVSSYIVLEERIP